MNTVKNYSFARSIKGNAKNLSYVGNKGLLTMLYRKTKMNKKRLL
jgi:hypothetical protein